MDSTRMVRGGQRPDARSRTYALMVGIVVGVLVTGVAVPFVYGERVTSRGDAVSSGPVNVGPEERSPEASGRDPDPDRPGPVPEAADGEGAPSVAAPTTRASQATRGQTARRADAVEEAVRVGILLLDLGGAAQLGFSAGGTVVSTDEQERIWQTLVDDQNRNGGAGGRTVEPVFRSFDALSPADQRAACLALTEDERVFAVLESTSGFNGPSALCVTEEHRTPLVTNATPAQFSPDEIRKSQQYFFGAAMSGARSLANGAAEWDRMGLLRDKKIGVLDFAGRTDTVDEGLLPELKRLGHSVVRRAVFSEDNGTAATQVPGEVLRMRSEGVDTVIDATYGLYATQFVQEATAQGFHPRYLTSDWFQATSDFTKQNMPESFDGAIGITSLRSNDIERLPATAAEKSCQVRYERTSGARIERRLGTTYPFVMLACSVLDAFVAGAARVGPDLTRDTLSVGMQQIGALEVAYAAPGSFRTGKFDAADQIATMRWRSNCRCWRFDGGFRPAAHR